MAELERTTFTEVTGITSLSPGEFASEVHSEWTIVGRPNGGYLLAMLGRAAAQSATHADVLAASAHYLYSPKPGPVRLSVAVLRTGRSASHVRVQMTQDDTPCVAATFTLGTLGSDTEPHWSAGLPEQVRCAQEDCEPVKGRPGLSIMDQVDLRIHPDDFGFGRGVPNGSGVVRGWLGLPGEENFDPISLLYAVDSFPPATLNIEITDWVPTLELTAYVRARPAPGPVRVLQRAQLIDDNRVDQSCYIWDNRDRLVAQATQLAGIRLAPPA